MLLVFLVMLLHQGMDLPQRGSQLRLQLPVLLLQALECLHMFFFMMLRCFHQGSQLLLQLVIAFLQVHNILYLLTWLLRSICNVLFHCSHLPLYIHFGCRLCLQLSCLLWHLLQQLALQRLILCHSSFCAYQFLLSFT